MKRNSKSNLFEMMVKVANLPEKSILCEYVQAPADSMQATKTAPQAPDDPTADDTKLSDVKILDKVTATSGTLTNAMAKINTLPEFKEAFKSWITQTQFNPTSGRASKTQLISMITRALSEMGYN